MWIGFILGLFFGVVVGIFVIGLVMMAAKSRFDLQSGCEVPEDYQFIEGMK